MSTFSPVVKPCSTPEFPRTAREIHALREAISPARLSTYLRHAHGNVRRSLDLYAWNIRASAALYPVLQVNEIVLRNTINRALASQFGPQWPYSQGFLRSLHKFERDTFEQARQKLEKNRRVVRAATGDVVAAQTYWFWVMLLTSRFDNRIWRREFSGSFPNAPPRIDRSIVHARTDYIRRIRNRIAHHEPLLDHDLVGVHRRAMSIVRWVSPAKAAWTNLHWPVDPGSLKRPG